MRSDRTDVLPKPPKSKQKRPEGEKSQPASVPLLRELRQKLPWRRCLHLLRTRILSGTQRTRREWTEYQSCQDPGGGLSDADEPIQLSWRLLNTKELLPSAGHNRGQNGAKNTPLSKSNQAWCSISSGKGCGKEYPRHWTLLWCYQHFIQRVIDQSKVLTCKYIFVYLTSLCEMMDLSLIKMVLNWKSPSWMQMWWSSVGFNPFARHPPKSSLSRNWDYVKSYVMQSLQRGTESVQLLVEFHLERQRVVSSNICTFVLVYAIRQLPAQMRRARAFTHFLGVFMRALMTFLYVRTQRGKPKESRTLERSGEGLAPARNLRFPKWTNPLRRKRLSPDSIRAPSPAPLNPLSGLGLFSFGPRRSEKRPEPLLHDGAALLLPPRPAITLPHSHQACVGGMNNGRGWFSSRGVFWISLWAGAHSQGRLGGPEARTRLSVSGWWGCALTADLSWVSASCQSPAGLIPSEGHGTGQC